MEGVAFKYAAKSQISALNHSVLFKCLVCIFRAGWCKSACRSTFVMRYVPLIETYNFHAKQFHLYLLQKKGQFACGIKKIPLHVKICGVLCPCTRNNNAVIASFQLAFIKSVRLSHKAFCAVSFNRLADCLCTGKTESVYIVTAFAKVDNDIFAYNILCATVHLSVYSVFRDFICK